jgi:hypothetical protein
MRSVGRVTHERLVAEALACRIRAWTRKRSRRRVLQALRAGAFGRGALFGRSKWTQTLTEVTSCDRLTAVEEAAHTGRTSERMAVDAIRLRCLEEVAEAARELPWQLQSNRLRTALSGLVQFMPPSAALRGPDDPYDPGTSRA